MDTLKGILFITFWASATVATKFALKSADLFLFTSLRFATVAVILQVYIYGIKSTKEVLPTTTQMKQLLVLGALSITLYMSGFLIAIENVSAGLISLIFSTNPLILILLSAVVLKNKVSLREWQGIAIAVGGLVVAAIPNLQNNHASFKGIVALLGGITSFSLGSIYFSKVKLALSNLTVNTWQITYGALLFIPLVLLNHNHNFLVADKNFYLSFAWLVVPVSILGYGLWLGLLQKDPVKAGKWLFLAPILGYAMAVVILKEPLTAYGIAGTILVLAGLIFSRKKVEAT